MANWRKCSFCLILVEMPASQTRRRCAYRKSYTRRGSRIAGRCIRSQSPYATPLGAPSRKALRGYAKSRRTLRSCPSGYIKRASYVRTRSGKKTLVPEQCIRNVGAPGKGLASGEPGIGRLREGELSKFGYSDVVNKPVGERRAALRKAVAAFGSLSVWRKLNAVHVYTRRLSPASSRVFKADMNWIKATFGLKAF